MNRDKKLLDIYSDRIAEFGDRPESLGWHKGRSNLRFHVLTEKWNLEDCTVLDFGCGFGDFYKFLSEKVSKFSYAGVDINPFFIEKAQSRFPGIQFEKKNLLESEEQVFCDYAFVSGVFNDRIGDNLGFIDEVFSYFHARCKRGFSCNFISDRVQFQDDHVFYADPACILKKAYEISNNVVLRNDYMPYEFTIHVDLHTEINPTSTIFEGNEQFL